MFILFKYLALIIQNSKLIQIILLSSECTDISASPTLKLKKTKFTFIFLFLVIQQSQNT